MMSKACFRPLAWCFPPARRWKAGRRTSKQYASSGSFTVTLSITRGTETAYQTKTINVTAPAESPGSL